MRSWFDVLKRVDDPDDVRHLGCGQPVAERLRVDGERRPGTSDPERASAQGNEVGDDSQLLRPPSRSKRRLGCVTEGFSTTEVPPRGRVEFWREMVRRHFVPLHMEPLADREFDGTVRLRSIGELDVARIRARPMIATRTQQHIDSSISDDYFVGLHLHGIARAEQDGRAATLMPGDFALFDSARPYTITFQAAGPFDHLIVRVPRDQLDSRSAYPGGATARAVKAGSAAGRLAAPALTTLASLDRAAPFVDPILDLIASAIDQTAGLTAPPRSRRQRILTDLKRYTLSHLADAHLTPTRVAHACFVSPRQLHRVFELDGTTFGAFVKDARLRRTYRDLADPNLIHLTIADIARHHGYRHAAAFTRALTERYGIGPRLFRQAQRQTAVNTLCATKGGVGPQAPEGAQLGTMAPDGRAAAAEPVAGSA